VNPQNFYAVMLVFVVANLLMLPLGYIAARLSRWIFVVPRDLLNAAILLFCIVGSFSINNSMFGVIVMLLLGCLAYILEKRHFAIAPIILGMVLGPLLEQYFITSMTISGGSLLGFFSRPVAAALGVLTLLVWGLAVGGTLYRMAQGRRRGLKAGRQRLEHNP